MGYEPTDIVKELEEWTVFGREEWDSGQEAGYRGAADDVRVWRDALVAELERLGADNDAQADYFAQMHDARSNTAVYRQAAYIYRHAARLVGGEG
jgi:hypothetical protein